MNSPAHQHALYRFFDARDRLLYVGITGDPENRFSAHRSDKPWWRYVTTIRIERFSTRKALAEAEIIAIQAEQPKYNRAHAAGWDNEPNRAPSTEPKRSIHPDASRFGTEQSTIAREPTEADLRTKIQLPCPECHWPSVSVVTDTSTVECLECGWTGNKSELFFPGGQCP
ncbi:GIY-YIG nuclease family protein [Mycolicibacterium brisbanense]